MASSEEMGPGKHRAVWRDSAGKKQHSKSPYFTTATDARRHAWEEEGKARRQASREQGTLSPSITWREWVEIWWPTRNIEMSTERSERATLVSDLMPQWGDEPLNAISRKVIQSWVDRMTLETSAGNAVRVYSILRASLTAALEEDILLVSPCVKIKLPVIPPAKIEHFEDDERPALLKSLGRAGRCYAEFAELMMETGMRPGEIGGLHVVNVNWNRRTIYVTDVLMRGGREIKSIPKDKEGREIPGTSRALEILAEWATSKTMRDGCGQLHVVKRTVSKRPCKSDLVFRQPNGAVYNENNFWAIFDRALTRAGLRHRPPYALRHTFATKLADAGVDVGEIARLMGHSRLEMSQRYIHRTRAASARVLAALGEPEVADVSRLGHGAESGTESGTRRVPTVGDHDERN